MLEKNRVRIQSFIPAGIASMAMGFFLLPIGVMAGGEHGEGERSETAEAAKASESVQKQAEAYEAAFEREGQESAAREERSQRDEEMVRGHHIERQRSVDNRRRGDPRRMNRPYSNYDEWMQQNPRYSHPVHEMVHRNSWSEQVRRNRERAARAQGPGGPRGDVRYEEPRVITPRDVTYDPNNWDKFYPYPRSRVIWYNDRYYDGKYYSNDENRETDRYYSRRDEGRDFREGYAREDRYHPRSERGQRITEEHRDRSLRNDQRARGDRPEETRTRRGEASEEGNQQISMEETSRQKTRQGESPSRDESEKPSASAEENRERTGASED